MEQHEMVKKPEEIALIAEGGRMLAMILDQVIEAAKPGVSLAELDRLAEQLIVDTGAIPSFKGYAGRKKDKSDGFPGVICTSVNNEIVHGVPREDVKLKDGDIVGLDIGIQYPKPSKTQRGFFTDHARTVPIGKVTPEDRKLLEVTYKSMMAGIAAVKPGLTIKDISRAVEKVINAAGMGIVRSYVGHGVGYAVHEEPAVPNFSDSKHPNVTLREGMALAIEPMVTFGPSGEVDHLADGWTVVSKDGTRAAHFEHTIAVTANGARILTTSD